eukprot:1548590-Pleurochrysis_carterae.AAC.5
MSDRLAVSLRGDMAAHRSAGGAIGSCVGIGGVGQRCDGHGGLVARAANHAARGRHPAQGGGQSSHAAHRSNRMRQINADAPNPPGAPPDERALRAAEKDGSGCSSTTRSRGA